MITKKSEDAVSPVIGIMLLVVVTVIIAAVITAFATGVVGSTEPAPVAALDVEILSTDNSLYTVKGPELYITHRSGDAVDTKDIELRFSWVCGVADCQYGGVHYSAYSADGCKEAHPDGIDIDGIKQSQALYVKSTMPLERPAEYGSGGINCFFGDVILIPGLKLTANSEFLRDGADNTNSIFMDVIFNNYVTHEGGGQGGSTHNPFPAKEHVSTGDVYPDTNYNQYCPQCVAQYGYSDESSGGYWMAEAGCFAAVMGAANENVCTLCYHSIDLCTGDGNPNNCDSRCYVGAGSTSPALAVNIMDHLPAGTPVDVMIVHLPSDKAIFDKTVIVQ